MDQRAFRRYPRSLRPQQLVCHMCGVIMRSTTLMAHHKSTVHAPVLKQLLIELEKYDTETTVMEDASDMDTPTSDDGN
jgi:hypothetical protein